MLLLLLLLFYPFPEAVTPESQPFPSKQTVVIDANILRRPTQPSVSPPPPAQEAHLKISGGFRVYGFRV